jgi:anti-repressor protein
MAEKAQAKVLELQPKAEFAEAISDSEDLLIMGDVCKVLGLKYGCITLYKHLVTLGVLNQQHIPYQEFVNRGYFKLCENKITDSYGKTHVTITTKVYQKGVKYIMELLKKNNLFNSTMAS